MVDIGREEGKYRREKERDPRPSQAHEWMFLSAVENAGKRLGVGQENKEREQYPRARENARSRPVHAVILNVGNIILGFGFRVSGLRVWSWG